MRLISLININLLMFDYLGFYVFLFLKIFFFLMWTIFKVFLEFVTILLLFYVLVFWQ